MTQSAVLGPFYEDLQNPAYFTNFAIYHRRFSTNTVRTAHHAPAPRTRTCTYTLHLHLPSPAPTPTP
eukprot:scaffold14037_cov47-Phaeocystis_antarctica.AAC.2